MHTAGTLGSAALLFVKLRNMHKRARRLTAALLGKPAAAPAPHGPCNSEAVYCGEALQHTRWNLLGLLSQSFSFMGRCCPHWSQQIMCLINKYCPIFSTAGESLESQDICQYRSASSEAHKSVGKGTMTTSETCILSCGVFVCGGLESK